jgi:hypothetical protein
MPFGRLIAEPNRLPTTHLYFLNAMDRLVGRWWQPRSRRAPIRAVGANCFVHGDAMVLVRRDTPRVLREALAWPGRLAYLIDDDVAAGCCCEHLPDAYRRQFARFEREFHRDLLARADLVVAPSQTLVERIEADPAVRCPVARIDPWWSAAPADTSHFAALDQGASLRVVHLGSGSHHAALAVLAPVMAGLLDRHPAINFTYIAASPVDPALEAHPHARRVEPKTWPEYRRWLARHRFHLALYPLMPDAFDRARSINKLVEHALVGAVGIYPEDWQPAGLVNGGALAAPSDPAQWEAAVEAAIARRDELAGLAQTAAQRLGDRDWPGRQRRLWGDFLGLRTLPGGGTVAGGLDVARVHSCR